MVTGASQGLGEAFVKVYRDRGWRAVGNSRSIAPSNDPDYITVARDVGKPEVAWKVVETALERFGRVDTRSTMRVSGVPAQPRPISEALYRSVILVSTASSSQRKPRYQP